MTQNSPSPERRTNGNHLRLALMGRMKSETLAAQMHQPDACLEGIPSGYFKEQAKTLACRVLK